MGLDAILTALLKASPVGAALFAICYAVARLLVPAIQQIRADAQPESNIAHMLRWLKSYPGEVITSRAHQD